MKKFFSMATLLVAVAGLFYGVFTVFKKRQGDQNIDDLIYTEDFDEFDENEEDENEEDSYFDLENTEEIIEEGKDKE